MRRRRCGASLLNRSNEFPWRARWESGNQNALPLGETYGMFMIRKLKSGQYRLYSRKKNPETGKRRNLGTFATREAAQQHEREVQFFKKH
jgi:hypothetical protein